MWAPPRMGGCWTGHHVQLTLQPLLNSAAFQPTPTLCRRRSLQRPQLCAYALKNGSRGSWQGEGGGRGGSGAKWAGRESANSDRKWAPKKSSPDGGKPASDRAPEDTTRRKWADKERPPKSGSTTNKQVGLTSAGAILLFIWTIILLCR